MVINEWLDLEILRFRPGVSVHVVTPLRVWSARTVTRRFKFQQWGMLIDSPADVLVVD